jgi:potassium channel subfamily K, other eukaryote
MLIAPRLLAATIGPLANVLSLAALVTYWRMDLDDGHGNRLPQLSGAPFRDPRWCYWLNVVSLICGFVGNLFLLFNFTGRVRYILALPATIFFWSVATSIVSVSNTPDFIRWEG